jgi:hypothetical protein
MATRLGNILSRKASMGMGISRRRYESEYESDSEDQFEDDGEDFGRGVMAGIGPSKKSKKAASTNPWIGFLKVYSEDNGVTYGQILQTPRILKKARAEYCQLVKKVLPRGIRSVCRPGSKTRKRVVKRKVVKRKPVKRGPPKKKCPKGKKLDKVRAYTTRKGKRVPSYYRCK